jgi:hypothetical protein
MTNLGPFLAILGVFAAAPAIAQSGSPQQAQRDYSDGRPLPRLPDLRKPVFLASGSAACTSRGALANPNRDIVVATGACIVTPRKLQVSVFAPANANDYMESHVFGSIMIEMRSAEISNATAYRAWVDVKSLQN